MSRQKTKRIDEKRAYTAVRKTLSRTEPSQPFTMDELEAAVRKMRRTGAPGPDDILELSNRE